jgi:hypothetical protein
MGQTDENFNQKLDEILTRLNALETKVSTIETGSRERMVRYNENYTNKDDALTNKEALIKESTEDSDQLLENKIGKYGLVWTGNIVLLFGITLITQYIQREGHTNLASIIGFLAVGLLFGLSVLMSKNLSYIGLMFKTTSILLLYYFTARLHFFTEAPIISAKWICLLLLLLINAYQYYLSVKLKSGMFGVIALFLTLSTAVISNTTHFMLSVIALTAIVSMYFVFKFNWRTLLVLSIVLVYTSFLIWMLSNPAMGNEVQIASKYHLSIIYLFIIASVYSILNLLPNNEEYNDFFILGSVLLNGIGFSFLTLFYVFSFLPTNYIWIFFTIFVFCLSAAAVFKFKSEWKFAAPLYALYSFVMLSVTVYGYYQLPNAFFILSIESLLVVSMALWFRSQFIVIMNGFLFIALLIAYLKLGDTVVGINFAFALTALITARVLNWKKERLEITTELLRNTYLVAAFFMMLYALYKAIPEDYITLLWTGTALLYYLLSRLLHNVKYRWMSIFTIIITALYLFIVDLDRISMLLRVVTIMALAIISILISIIYTKKSNS